MCSATNQMVFKVAELMELRKMIEDLTAEADLMVATQFQQGHVLRSIQDAGRLSKLLGQDNFAFNVIDFVAIVLSHGSVLPFCCSKL